MPVSRSAASGKLPSADVYVTGVPDASDRAIEVSSIARDVIPSVALWMGNVVRLSTNFDSS